MGNLLAADGLGAEAEFFETLLSRPGVRIERIVSRGQVTPPERPYLQPHAEWVLVLKGRARIRIEDRPELMLGAGDHLLVPASARHWVTFTADPTIWLALHFEEPESPS